MNPFKEKYLALERKLEKNAEEKKILLENLRVLQKMCPHETWDEVFSIDTHFDLVCVDCGFVKPN